MPRPPLNPQQGAADTVGVNLTGKAQQGTGLMGRTEARIAARAARRAGSPGREHTGQWGAPVDWRVHMTRTHLHEILQVR